MKKRNSGERGCIILIALFLFALLMFCFSSKMFYSSEEIIVKPINEDILASYSDVDDEEVFAPSDGSATIYIYDIDAEANEIAIQFEKGLEEDSHFLLFNSSKGIEQYQLADLYVKKDSKTLRFDFDTTDIESIKILAMSFDLSHFVRIPHGSIFFNRASRTNVWIEGVTLAIIVSILGAEILFRILKNEKGILHRYCVYLKMTGNTVNRVNLIRVFAALMVFLLHSTLFESNISSLYNSNNRWAFIWHPSAWAGVWIFFVTGGYFAGIGFATGKYAYSREGIIKYYKKRLLNVVLPTVCFILFCGIFCYPDFWVENAGQIFWKFFTFQYIGTPGIAGIGATWYISTLMILYLLTPIVGYFIEKIKNVNKHILDVLIVILIFGGLGWRLYALKNSMDWNAYVYCPFWANIDLYFGGLVFSYINNGSLRRRTDFEKILATGLFFVTIISNAYVYYWADKGFDLCGQISMYYYQTIYLVVCLFYLYVFGNMDSKPTQCSLKQVLRNPLRVIDSFANISFEFYLFHSLILYLWADKVEKVGILTNGSQFRFICIIFTMTVIASMGYHKIFSNK